MTWYWYTARRNELFIDMDRYAESIAHVRVRLQGAIECGALDVVAVHDYESSPNKHHVIIVLAYSLTDMERYAWEMVLHSDIYRTASNMMRSSKSMRNPDLFISRYVYPNYRTADTPPYDALCQCPEKHTRKVMDTCPAALELRGTGRTETFFGKPSKNPCTFL